MYRINGLYLPTHRPMAVPPTANQNRKTEVAAVEPLAFARLFLMAGLGLAAVILAGMVSG